MPKGPIKKRTRRPLPCRAPSNTATSVFGTRWSAIFKMSKLPFERQIALIDSVKTPDDEYEVTSNPNDRYIWYWSDVSNETMIKLNALLDKEGGGAA